MHSFVRDESVSVPAAHFTLYEKLFKAIPSSSATTAFPKIANDGKGRVDNIVPHYKANAQ